MISEPIRRMLLNAQQQYAVIHLDDHGVKDPVPLYVMDFKTWQKYHPENFFAYFAPEGTVAAYARLKPAWQRYSLLYVNEAQALQTIYDSKSQDATKILRDKKLSKRFYQAYVEMSGLADELDALIDRDLIVNHRWNQGYILNDSIIV